VDNKFEQFCHFRLFFSSFTSQATQKQDEAVQSLNFDEADGDDQPVLDAAQPVWAADQPVSEAGQPTSAARNSGDIFEQYLYVPVDTKLCHSTKVELLLLF
jgi:hypothetical protein